MNWGWSKDFNGWFLNSAFNPGNHNYNINRKMTQNIIP